ncbi:MAG TPA: universal stress protein [Geobacteraceae bacterium]|nr:universal stress protein [Geobacteraceae bacterium]
MKKFNKILFATDLTEFSECAFDYALILAKEFNAKLIILHVINQPIDLRGFYVPHISFETIEQEIKKSAEKMMDEFCIKKIKGYDNYEQFIVSGIPDIEILNKADTEKVDLIVIGTHGRVGVDRFLFGSTAEKVVRKALCPVMTVRPPEIKA